MSKYDELKRLADKAIPSAEWFRVEDLTGSANVDAMAARFIAEATPAAILELIAENERLEAELRVKDLAYAADAIAYRGAVYRMRRERAGTEIGPAGLQRMFLLGYNRSAALLQAMLDRGDLTPIDGKPHCGWVHCGNDSAAEEAAK